MIERILKNLLGEAVASRVTQRAEQGRQFLKETIAIDDTDFRGSMEGIEKDMVFRGHSVWILIFSIFIASLGLNQNSAAVIIGAMLISPLMGPIIGIGLGIGTSDWSKVKRALRNLSIAVVVALLTSTLYFTLSPLDEAHSELLARTKPTILDVLVAFFGGAAGIVAGSRREKSNVIPGVAIATALMPPLCTAGYGIATGQWNFFLGAFYLFFINSVFISLSTILIIRYLGFPRKQHDPHREKLVNRYIFFFVVLVALPSGMIFVDVIQETQYNRQANLFIAQEFGGKNYKIINANIEYSDTVSSISIYAIGEPIDEAKIDSARQRMAHYNLAPNQSLMGRLLPLTKQTRLHVHQSGDNTDKMRNEMHGQMNELSQKIRTGVLEDLYKKNEELMRTKDDRIRLLEAEVLKRNNGLDGIEAPQLMAELKVQYPGIDRLMLSTAIAFDGQQTDTVPLVLIKWSGKSQKHLSSVQQKQLGSWLKIRLKKENLQLHAY